MVAKTGPKVAETGTSTLYTIKNIHSDLRTVVRKIFNLKY